MKTRFSKPIPFLSFIWFPVISGPLRNIVSINLAGCEVQKDTGILSMKGSGGLGEGRQAASSSLPGNGYTEVHTDYCGGPNTL